MQDCDGTKNGFQQDNTADYLFGVFRCPSYCDTGQDKSEGLSNSYFFFSAGRILNRDNDIFTCNRILFYKITRVDSYDSSDEFI